MRSVNIQTQRGGRERERAKKYTRWYKPPVTSSRGLVQGDVEHCNSARERQSCISSSAASSSSATTATPDGVVDGGGTQRLAAARFALAAWELPPPLARNVALLPLFPPHSSLYNRLAASLFISPPPYLTPVLLSFALCISPLAHRSRAPYIYVFERPGCMPLFYPTRARSALYSRSERARVSSRNVTFFLFDPLKREAELLRVCSTRRDERGRVRYNVSDIRACPPTPACT